jgi:cytochrome c nitrite reductase small subunit
MLTISSARTGTANYSRVLTDPSAVPNNVPAQGQLGEIDVRVGYIALAAAGLIGVAVGVSTFTFQYAEGFSYMSNDPKACVNCHIMRPQYEGWLKSSHHAVATCNDCHTSAGFIPKYIDKAINGYHHSKAFTLQNFHEPIMIGPRNAQILQNNCVRCHQQFVDPVIHGGTNLKSGAINCVQCHRDVGHHGK